MLKILRSVLLALLASLVTGLAIGTWIRIRMEQPERYFIGAAAPTGTTAPTGSSLAARAPGDVGHVGAPVLGPGHHEEQVG